MTEARPIGTLVLIDDNAVDQMLCKRLVDRSELVEKFIGFLSAEDALEYLRNKPVPAVDAILLDINMPRMDGFEFLDAATRELGENFVKIVVMMLTTSLNPRDEARASQYAVVKEYCNKPLLLDYLHRLARLLEEK